MEAKKGLTLDNYGRPILDSEDLVGLLYNGKNINGVLASRDDEEINLYIKYRDELLNNPAQFLEPESTLTFDEFHEKSSEKWNIPEEYKNIDLLDWLINKCSTDEQKIRVIEEYQMYEERDLLMLLRFFIFLIDHMRKNKFMWGVGRGSSVSSYILYLIGIHRVDSLKYNLSIKEFLK